MNTQQPRGASWDLYIAGPEILGHRFEYPSEYLECIAWGDQDIEAGGDGHALAFLETKDVQLDLVTFARLASNRRLVPFARGGNGDELYCFDGEQAKTIYVIDLGVKPLRARNTGHASFLEFINAYRSNLDLPGWVPKHLG